MLQAGRDRIAVDQVLAVARGEPAVALDPDPGFRAPPPARLRDRDPLRCAPHVAGVLVEALEREGSLPLGPDLRA